MNSYPQINQLLKESSYFYTIAIGMDSLYSYVNANYDRNFKSGMGTLLGQHFSITLHPDDIAICEEAGALCFTQPGQLFPATLRKHDGHGGYVTTQWEMQAIINNDGQPEGIFCIGYNITEFLDTRSQLTTAHTQLDEIGFMQSHVVRKPLANIIGLTELVAEETDQDKRQKLCAMLRESTAELDRVIKDISDKTD